MGIIPHPGRGDMGGCWRVIPMCGPGRPPHAEDMETTTTRPQDSQDAAGPQAPISSTASAAAPELVRPARDRMIAGVAAAAARYLGVDVTIVRILLAVLTVAGGAGIPVYLAGWLLIPDEGARQSIAADLIDSYRHPAR